MPRPWQNPLIEAHKAHVQQILEEIEQANDLDLWEEMDAKATDVIVIYRRSLNVPNTFKFSDGVTRTIDEIAFAHACVEVFPEMFGREDEA